MLNITHLEKAWQDYLDSQDGSLTSWGRINLVAWMGERMGPVLEEIKRLRAEIAQCHIYLDESYVNDPERAGASSLLERIANVVGQLYEAQAERDEPGRAEGDRL